MSKQTKKYGILVAVDGSRESDAAVRWATDEAILHDAPITLAHVVVPVVVSWPVRYLQAEFNRSQEDNARQVLEQAESWFAPVGISPRCRTFAERFCTTMTCLHWYPHRRTPGWSSLETVALAQSAAPSWARSVADWFTTHAAR